MSGKELRLKRVAADVKVYELASEMGVHSSRVSQIEALAIVTPDTEQRYLAALAATQVGTSSESAATAATGAA